MIKTEILFMIFLFLRFSRDLNCYCTDYKCFITILYNINTVEP